MIRMLLAIVMLAGFNQAWAVQNYSVKNGDTITATLSSKDLTRIAIEGGRLEKVWSTAGIIEVQPDQEKGEVFIRPLPGSASTISFFVTDSLGSTYTILGRKKDVPSESIIIKPKGVAPGTPSGQRYKSQPYVGKIKDLVKAMALNEPLIGYSEDAVSATVPLWLETQINLHKRYSNHKLIGEVYSIENISAEDLVFHEREFLDFGEAVQAVALEKLKLTPNEKTLLFVVRTNQEQ